MSAIPLTDIRSWQRELGLFPVPLSYAEPRETAFVLLNGTKGNFCLETGAAKVKDDPRSVAWSTNVGHYLMVTNEYVEVQRWDQASASLERYKTESVAAQLSKFHACLESSCPKSDISVIAHSTRIFRKLRAALHPDTCGAAALKAFLYLLACATDSVERSQLSGLAWQLDERAA